MIDQRVRFLSLPPSRMYPGCGWLRHHAESPRIWQISERKLVEGVTDKVLSPLA